MRSILVTGGAGYIGSHTVVELANAGYNPVIIDNFSNSDISTLQGLEKIIGKKVVLYEGNFQDKKLLTEIINKEEIDGVVHFAASKSVDESITSPIKYYQNNVSGLVDLLEVILKLKINNFVFSSSAAVYGDGVSSPVTEKSECKPMSPYGWTKYFGEVILSTVCNSNPKFSVVALRYFNAIGAHPSGLIGERSKEEAKGLIPQIAMSAAGIKKLTIFGDDYPTPDGTCIRDFIHVVDLARAHVDALRYIVANSGFQAINIGTGKGVSVLEAVTAFEEISGQKVPYKVATRRPGDIIVSFASADKAKQLLKWKAHKSVNDALSDTWRWQQNLSK